jgi:hypothetical protein
MLVSATGHRPHLLGGYTSSVYAKLYKLVHRSLVAMEPTRVLVGMAQGWDQAVAQAAVDLGVPFKAIIPGFANGMTQDNTWPLPAQRRYLELLARAADVEWRTWPGAKREFYDRDMQLVLQGEWMLALWNGQRSGTGTTIAIAVERNRPIWNVWGEWTNG